MRAAVVFTKGALPKLVDNFPEPLIGEDHEVLISVKASAIKNLDRAMAAGVHYSIGHELDKPKIVGGDGVGLLGDGTRVYGIGKSGMVAEKAIIDSRRMVCLPEGIDDVTAATLPNAVMGSAMALRFRANLKTGETILINGATGTTGKMAIQMARYYGAGRIIATGRNEESLMALRSLGADELILLRDDEPFLQQVRSMHRQTPMDVVLDYLWGHSAECLLNALKGGGDFTHRTRYITVGGMADDTIRLSSSILRGTDIQLSGSGLGSWTKEEVYLLLTEILPEMFQLAADGKLIVDTHIIGLDQVENLWDTPVPAGKRLVVRI